MKKTITRKFPYDIRELQKVILNAC